jgi:3-phenylpropionate/cinnamic acid dioxygenase small subunit
MTMMTPEQFLFLEARLMDEMRYDEWFALWLDSGTYWVPVNAGDDNPRRQVSIIYDDYLRLEQRIDRLKSGSVLAVEEQRGAMRRIVSNIEVSETGDDDVHVEANFMLGIARTREQQIWMGRSVYDLKRTPDGLRIAAKKVLLINSAREIPLLQFLI